jgi:hypothetical protein
MEGGSRGLKRFVNGQWRAETHGTSLPVEAGSLALVEAEGTSVAVEVGRKSVLAEVEGKSVLAEADGTGVPVVPASPVELDGRQMGEEKLTPQEKLEEGVPF